ncbi:hypothetical protein [Coleofasciculus sp. FACHB-SPT36]|uniref:hypothetical protein n=1 Tax=Cyanophyceae TaxID=3028117 RepID=UPI00168AF88E|nr:hypothetical protein [Coleofasciculus sp. FACHB-SPT36]MBD2541404.1 hypothetical protein [Coleofasciculus sp. FACHB-SPT36]
MLTLVRAEKSCEYKLKHCAAIYLVFRKYFETSTSNREVASSYNNEVLVLSERDSEFFLAVMENPPEPSEGLLSVFE